MESLRYLARTDRYFLIRYLFNRKDFEHDWLYARCREVEAKPNGYLDLWARDHRKSTIITYAGTIQDILASHGDNPEPEWKGIEPTFGIFSHTRPIARKFLRQIKHELQFNIYLLFLFPDVLFQNPERDSPKWSENDGIIVRRKTNPKESTVEGWGLVDGMPTGAHYWVRIYDDVVTRKSIATPEMAAKTLEAWELSLNLGVDDGQERYAGTRYGIFDTYREIMARGAAIPRIYPATHDGTASGTPVLLSQKALDGKKRQGQATFAAQMLQKPISRDTATFDIAHLQFAEVRPKTINIFILGDPANSKKKDSDRTGMAVLAMDAQRNFYLVDGFNHKMNLKERWDALRSLHVTWSNATGVQGVRVGYERYGLQADIEHFQTQMEIEGRTFEIEEVNWVREGSQSKDDRIGRLRPDFERGHFFLPSLCKVSGKLCFIKVVDGDVKYVEAKQETKLMRQVARGGQLYRVLRPISRKDEQGQLYDLSIRFITEYLAHPALGSFKDLLDATSRVYDMEPKPPVVIDEKDLEPESFHDS